MHSKEAHSILDNGGSYAALVEAIGTIASDSASSLHDIMKGLRHGGLIAEQAALALYKRSGRPLPEDRATMVVDPDQWAAWITQSTATDRSTASR